MKTFSTNMSYQFIQSVFITYFLYILIMVVIQIMHINFVIFHMHSDNFSLYHVGPQRYQKPYSVSLSDLLMRLPFEDRDSIA